MKKQIGAAFLLAGTAIGSGMISLPMVLAKFGIVNTFIIMIFFSVLTYITAIIRADLNLNSHAGATLKEVGTIFQCSTIGKIGDILLKILSFALMSAYLFGLSSIFSSFLKDTIQFNVIILSVSVIVALFFLCISEIIVYVNKFLFIALFATFIILVVTLFLRTNIKIIPLNTEAISFKEWTTLIPVIFTSFGFQGSIHSMTKFCRNERNLIKNACLWGSIIPAIVYIIWTIAILIVVVNTDATFFELMLKGKATNVGNLIAVLSKASDTLIIHDMVWIVSILSILTSIFGVGLALLDIFQQELKLSKLASIAITVFIPAIVSVLIPNAFIRILNISGIILAIIAIIVPLSISMKMQETKKVKLLMKNKLLMILTFACGIGIILLGICDLKVY